MMLTEEEARTLARLHEESVDPGEGRRWVSEAFDAEVKLQEIDERIGFEREVYGLYGRSAEDNRLYRNLVEPLVTARRDLLRATDEGVVNSLKNVGLLAFGLRLPVTASSRYSVVLPILWSVLDLDFEKAVARGGGNEYRDVRVAKVFGRPAPEIRLIHCALAKLRAAAALAEETGVQAQRQAVASGATPSSGVEAGTQYSESGTKRSGLMDKGRSFPGRPSVMSRVKAKLEARGAAGELLPSWKAECGFLAEWIESDQPGHQTPKWKTIYNTLASDYRRFRGAAAAR